MIQEFPDEDTAFAAEKFLIAYYGRKDNGTGILRNLTDGGENPPNHKGKKRSPESRAKLSQSCMGRKPNSTSFKVGHAVPVEWMEKSSKAHIGRKPSFTSFVKGMTPWNKGIGKIVHGTNTAYGHYKCRCSECRANQARCARSARKKMELWILNQNAERPMAKETQQPNLATS